MNLQSAYYTKGQSLIEILLAMGLAVIAISAVAYALLGPQASVRQSSDRLRAEILVKEGLQAVRSMAEASFADLVPGTHGLQNINNQWQFYGDNDTNNDFARSIILTPVNENIYEVTSAVAWDINGVRESDVALTTYVSNWRQTAGEAAHVVVAVDDLEYNASGTALSGATLENEHVAQPLTITELQLAWEGDAQLEAIWVDGEEVSGLASSSPVDSGVSVDIADVVLDPDAPAVSFGPFSFTGDMQNATVHVTSIFGDGSKRYTYLVP